MKTNLLTAICLALSFCTASELLAQKASISGTITNGDAAAEFINVILFKAGDTSIVKLELADETGAYHFKNLAADSYFIRTSGIGYQDQDHPSFTLAEDEAKVLETIDLQSTAMQLETVEVVGRKPFLEQRAGRLVVNVADNITGQGGSVTDLLKKVPGIIVIGENVSMAGKSGLTILIDGRPTKYMDIQSLLREMPADNIKSIEVITQPGAAMDAEGSGGVINIILKKNALLGTNGSAYVGAGYGELLKYRAGVSLNHRSGPVNITGGIGYNHRSWIDGLDLTRIVGDEVFDQTNREEGLPHSYSARLGIDYDLNDQHRIGINTRGYISDSPYTGLNTTRVLDSESREVLSTFTTQNIRERTTTSFNADAFYRWKIDTSGQELTIDGSYSYFNRDSRKDLITDGDLSAIRRNTEPAIAQIYTAQIDYKLPLNKQWRFETGAKYSTADLDNELIATILNGSVWENDSDFSNHFLYNESVAAAYTQAHYQGKKIEATFGLRYEHTETMGNNLTIDSINNLNYSQLFPSMSVNIPFNKVLGLALAYSYRLERPNYYDLNPFISFLDPLTFNKGNPFLRPELIHSGSLSLTYEKQPFFNLSYDHTNDVISSVTQQDDSTGIAFQTTVNLDNYTRYGGQLFFPLDFIAKPISGYAGVMGYFHRYNSSYLGDMLNNSRFSWTGFAQVNVNLPQSWKLEVTGWYQGAGLDDGLLRSNALYGVDAGVQKKFFDDKVNFQLSADGIIQKFFSGTIEYQNQNMGIYSYWEAPVVNMRITYNFGNRFLKKRDRIKTSGSEARQRVNIDN
ncbi:MAG: outer membrane beta-barrel protein [Bacteroidota bacterium]